MTPGTILKATLGVLGLSQAEAAAYLRVSPDTVGSWARDRRRIPPGVWGDLAALYERMQTAADAALDVIDEMDEMPPSELDLWATGKHGRWPSEGCGAAVAALVVLGCGIPPASK